MKRAPKASPRFLLDADAIGGGIARITGAELHHLRDVARIAPGEEVTLIAGDGVEHLGRLLRFESQCALVEIVESRARVAGVAMILAAAIIKGPRMDFLVEKAAELGATELWPLVCARSVAKDPG